MPDYHAPGVYLEEVPSGSRPIEGVGTAIAGFVGLAEKGPADTPTLIANKTQFKDVFGGPVEGSFLSQSVEGYFDNGGGKCYVVKIGSNGNGSADSSARAELPSAKDPKVPALRVEAREPGADGDAVAVEVTAASGGIAEDTFDVVVKKGREVVEKWPNVTTKKGKQNVVTVLNEQSKVVTVAEVSTGTLEAPATGSITLTRTAPSTLPVLAKDDYVGSVADRSGLSGLEAVDEVTMLCIPDLMAAYVNDKIDLDGVKAVQNAMITHCEQLGDRVAILDTPPGLGAQAVKDWRLGEKANYDSKYATLYWPWVKVPTAQGTFASIPPSGHVAGVWARNDATRGVHKAPANEVIRNVNDLDVNITREEQGDLNRNGINCLRSFSGRGIRVWGARTLSTTDTTWKYVNVRRLFNYIEESILEGTEWAVFEPNDHGLWAKMRRTITAFLTNEWRKGALFGLNPEEAFYVKCDEETNPPESVDLGQVICEIGVAPVKPAEFVVFRLAQLQGGAAVTE